MPSLAVGASKRLHTSMQAGLTFRRSIKKAGRKSHAWANHATLELSNGHVMTRSSPAANDGISIESFGAFGTVNWRPICSFFVSRLTAFLTNVWMAFPVLYSSAVPILRTTSVLQIGMILKPTWLISGSKVGTESVPKMGTPSQNASGLAFWPPPQPPKMSG